MRFIFYLGVAILSWTVVRAAVDHQHAHHHTPSSVSTPDDVPPPGWVESCEPAAIGFVCHTYPPGDRRWEPPAPVPPQRPLPTPWPGGEDAR